MEILGIIVLWIVAIEWVDGFSTPHLPSLKKCPGLYEIIYLLDSRYVYPLLDKFTVQLISPFSWEVIPNTK